MRKVSIGLSLLVWVLLAYGIFWALAAAQPQAAAPCFTDQDRQHVATLTRAAIDTAFQAHVQKLFDVWISDPTEQPRRAMTGMANGLSAYQRAQANAQAWKPEICR